jgi:hypothetical protein
MAEPIGLLALLVSYEGSHPSQDGPAIEVFLSERGQFGNLEIIRRLTL